MAEFNYKAIDKAGKTRVGDITADSKRAALEKLAGMGLSPVYVRRQEEDSPAESSSDSKRSVGGGERTALALITKLHQLCVGGGMPVADALKALSQRAVDKRLKKISRELYKDLSEGKMLANALESSRVN